MDRKKDVIEDETYHVIVDSALEARLRALQAAASGEPMVSSGPTPVPCPACREDLRTLGLPEGTIFQCGHR